MSAVATRQKWRSLNRNLQREWGKTDTVVILVTMVQSWKQWAWMKMLCTRPQRSWQDRDAEVAGKLDIALALI